METTKRVLHYLAHLEWTERVQPVCKFCDRNNFRSIVYEDDTVIAIENLQPAGQFHWLIMPKLHLIRDVESVKADHLFILYAMDHAKNYLLDQHCAGIARSAVTSGYHRGRRPLIGKVYYPDIISIHHLHLHVIVCQHLVSRLFKHPAWLPLMWKSDARVLRDIRRQA